MVIPATNVETLRRIYPDGCARFVLEPPTCLDGYALELFRWLGQAERIVNFARRLGPNAPCYIEGGSAAIENAGRFLAWGLRLLETEGPPKP